MAPLTGAALLWCAVLGAVAAEADQGSQFITEPQDAVVPPGSHVELDCELVDGDVCAWRINGTSLGVDHFYNVEPPPKVHALFPDHERVCSLVITDIDWRYDGYWTCWPLGQYSHYSSRAARITVSGSPVTTEQPTPEPSTTPVPPEPSTTPVPPEPSTTPVPPEPSTTPAPEPTTTPAPEPTTTPAPEPTTTPAPEPTTTPAPEPDTTTPGPSPDFVCPSKFGLFADPLDDSYFYFCEDGVAVHLQCEYPMHWNDSMKRCA